MEIKAKSKLDFDTIRALTHLWIFKKADPKKRLIFWTIACAILFAIVVLELIIFNTDISLFIIICSIIIIYLLECYFYFVLPKIKYRSLTNMKDAENEYIFYDNVIKAFTKSKEYNGEAEIEYSMFVKVYETSKYLFLYQRNSQVFVIDKSTVIGGSIEDIRKKLSSFVADKYFICKY